MRHEQLKRILIQNIENSGIEIGAAYFVLKDVLHEVEKEYSRHIGAQLKETEGKEKQNDDTDA